MRLGQVEMMRLARRGGLRFGASLALAVIAVAAPAPAGGADRSRGLIAPDSYEARALFEKLWEPGVAARGDGLGPLYNERSCVGCHHQGGTGGAGNNQKSVTILAALAGAAVGGGSIFQGELDELHPGFRNRTSIVLHQHSTAASDETRLAEIRRYAFVQTRDDLFALSQSQRSTPALFGAGQIDAIPDQALTKAEARTFAAFPEIKGRVSRLRDGRLGKFGWKGQTASLADFVRAACANELGLEVRGHHQPSLLSAQQFDPQALVPDLTEDDCALMTRFVANLAAPDFRPNAAASWGAAVFEGIGCATCHAPTMGSVRGLYSDLLLHDLGDRFRAFGGGYGSSPTSEVVDRPATSPDARPSAGEAGPTEWRTTPLWGVATSAPYLHDGRAPTLNEAILLHGGEADATAKRYRSLAPADRQALLAFLRSQVAPPPPGRPGDLPGRPTHARRG